MISAVLRFKLVIVIMPEDTKGTAKGLKCVGWKLYGECIDKQ